MRNDRSKVTGCEWDRVPRSDKWEITIHTRNDFAIENTDMITMAYDVGVDGSDYTGA